jgi:glycosyltransferase involved in cell wall biosynthesis
LQRCLPRNRQANPPPADRGAVGLSGAFRVLIPFNTVAELYGAERSIIEIFDLLRPEVDPVFVVSQMVESRRSPVFLELLRRGMTVVHFRDSKDWPRLQRPRSLREAVATTTAFLRGNRDILRHARHCDAIYLPGANYAYFALAAMALYRLRRKPVLHQFHAFALQRVWQVGLVNRFASAHIHLTQSGLRAISALHPEILRRRNEVIPLVVELPDCSDLPEMLEAFRGHRNVVYAGQISRTKGIDILLDALGFLAPVYPGLRLHLLGTSAREDAPVLDARIAAAGDRVIHWDFREDVPAFFRNAYLAIQATPPSRCSESFGRTAMEASLCGAPVVCLGSGALRELVLDGETGTICQDETPASLARAIARYLDDAVMRDRHAAHARRHSATRVSRDAVRNAWLLLLR